MANVWAIKNGDWSDPTVWNIGALPAPEDDVYANNFTVNVNQNIYVQSLRNMQAAGISIGGVFAFNTGNVTAHIDNNIFFHSGNFSVFLHITATSGTVTVNIPLGIISTYGSNQTIIAHSGNCNFTLTAVRLVNGDVNNPCVISKSSAGDLIVNADVVGGGTGSNNGVNRTILITAGINNIVNGNVTGGKSPSEGGVTLRIITGNLTINGNVIGGSGALSGVGTIDFSSIGSLTIIGNVTGNISPAVRAISGVVNIIGTVTGSKSNGVVTVLIVGSTTLNHIGTAQASDFSSAIGCNSPLTASIYCTGPFLKNGYMVAIASQALGINFNSNSYFQFKKSDGDDIDYVSTVEGYNYPMATDVRDGVVYKSGLVTGTLKVPNPADVRKSIPTDHTVGTADITPEDFIIALENSSANIAKRLRNCATVESTGAQVAAYE